MLATGGYRSPVSVMQMQFAEQTYCNCRGRCKGHAPGKTVAQHIAEAAAANREVVAAAARASLPEGTDYETDFRCTPESALSESDADFDLRRARIFCLNELLAAQAEAKWQEYRDGECA